MGRAEIFIGDLSFFCHENDIFQLFSQYGQVMEVRIKKSEGNGKSLMFGFVKMESLEAADEVIRKLNGIMFMGRILKVQYSQGKNNFMNSEPQGYQVHVAFRSFFNLAELRVVNEEVLRSIFQRYGEIADVVVKEYKVFRETNSQEGYAFITFIQQQAADLLINEMKGMNLDGVDYSFGVGSHSKVFVRKHNAPHQISQNPFILHQQGRRMPSPQHGNPSFPPAGMYYNNPVGNQGPNRMPGMNNMMSTSPHSHQQQFQANSFQEHGHHEVPPMGSSMPAYTGNYQPYMTHMMQSPLQVSSGMNMQMFPARAEPPSAQGMQPMYASNLYNAAPPAQQYQLAPSPISIPPNNFMYYAPQQQQQHQQTSPSSSFYYQADPYVGRSQSVASHSSDSLLPSPTSFSSK